MSLRPYPEYKASGIGWFEDIPSHWQLLPVFAVLQERGETNEDGEEINVLSVMKDRGVIPYSEKGNVGNKKSENIRRYKLVRQGDIVLNSMNIIIGSVGLSVYDGCLSPVYYVLGARSTHANTVYLSKVFQLKRFQRSLVRLGNGILAHRMRIPMDKLKRELLPIPPPDEQDAIVRFLDVAEKRIRRYIRAKQKLIKLLNEQKQAIIQQAVTRGLNPDVPMKDSSVEWLGEIPEHWKTIKLKFLVSTLGGMTPSKSEEKYWDGDIPWVSPKDMKVDVIKDSQDHITQLAVDETNISIVPSGSLLMVVRGMILARRVPVAVTACPVTINQDMKALVAKSSLRSDYLRLMFQGLSPVLLFFVEESGHGTRKFPTENWANLQLPIPSVDEQEYLLEHIQISTSELDDIIKQNEDQIDLIREYRTRLIADVVTGKIDVRGLAFEMPEEFGDDLEDDFEDESSLEDEMELEDIGDE